MESGLVYVLDYEGHQIQRFPREKGHTKAVTDLCFDAAAEALASCSADGTVLVRSLYSEETYTFGSSKSPSHGTSLTSIAIDPRWSIRKSKEVIYGTQEGTVVLASKGWLGPNETVLFKGQGPVWFVRRKGNFLAWSSPTGVRVYDTSNHTRIGKVAFEAVDVREGENPPILLEWGSNERPTLLLGFGTTVKVCTILPSNSMYKLDVRSTFSVEQGARILGFTSRNGPGVLDHFDHLLLVSDQKGLTTVRGYKDTGQELFSDRLPEENVKLLLPAEGSSTTFVRSTAYIDPLCSDGSISEQTESTYDDRLLYIYGPQGIVVVQTRSTLDRVQWLQDRCRFDEALEVAKDLEESNEKILQVGEAYLKQLFEAKDYVAAAQVAPRVLGSEAVPWERWVFLFGQAGMLHLLAPALPISSPTLAPATYDLAASACLTTTGPTPTDGVWLRELQDIARRWPPGVYDAKGLLSKIKARLAGTSASSSSSDSASSRRTALLSVAALLYAALGEHEEALKALVQAGRQPSVSAIVDLDPFEYVITHGLIGIAVSMVGELMELDARRTLTLLIDAAEDVDVARVVSGLQHNPDWGHHLYDFLDASWRRDPSSVASFADLYILLCANYEPSRLHYLLTVDTSYHLDAALKACRAHGLINESVYVLGRMGSWEEALRLVVTTLRDVKSAVDLLQEQNDQSRVELWDLLLGLVSQQADSKLTGSLLDYADGVAVDPVQVINSIPDGMVIERLRDRIVRLIVEIDGSREIRRGCAAALRSDCLELLDALLTTLKRGLRGI